MRADNHETAYAKINLALHVRHRRPDGYHELDTIFAFLDCGDEISVQSADGLNLDITGPFASGLSNSNNLIIDAGNLLADHCDIAANAGIVLNKQLPIASGIGGGSADAAAAMRLLNRFWQLDFSLAELAKLSEPLGADVPACVYSQSARACGIGQDLEFFENGTRDPLYAVLINPLAELSTAEVFRRWDGLDKGELRGSDLLSMATSGRNDLESAASAMVPAINEILTYLADTNCLLARMSGSGATCFGLYETQNLSQEAQSKIAKHFPDMWNLAGKVR